MSDNNALNICFTIW